MTSGKWLHMFQLLSGRPTNRAVVALALALQLVREQVLQGKQIFGRRHSIRWVQVGATLIMPAAALFCQA